MTINKIQFKYIFNPQHDEHEVTAFDNSGQMGRLLWDDGSGEISHLHVGEPHRRQGVATALWETAHEEAESRGITPPEHSSSRTEEGDSWARSVGGYVPTLRDDVNGWSQR